MAHATRTCHHSTDKDLLQMDTTTETTAQLACHISGPLYKDQQHLRNMSLL